MPLCAAERQCLASVRKGNTRLKTPRTILACVNIGAAIVVSKSGFDIFREAGVVTIREGNTAKNVGVVVLPACFRIHIRASRTLRRDRLACQAGVDEPAAPSAFASFTSFSMTSA